LRRKYIVLAGIMLIATILSGCKPLEKIFYPTKRSYNFNQVVDRIVDDLDNRNNRDLASYFTIKVRKQYGTKNIIQELQNAEKGLGKIRNFRAKEGGGSGHRGGLGETVRAWDVILDTDQGKFYAIVSWSSGDISKDEKLERETEGIKNLMLFSEEYNNSEGLDQFVDVDFPVLYPGIKR
jgi:hypothetical protein